MFLYVYVVLFAQFAYSALIYTLFVIIFVLDKIFYLGGILPKIEGYPSNLGFILPFVLYLGVLYNGYHITTFYPIMQGLEAQRAEIYHISPRPKIDNPFI